jgi:hypothetical protein
MRRLHFFFPQYIGGQSLRAGGATALVLAGASPAIIQASGRWASTAFQIYIRKHPRLFKPFCLVAMLCNFISSHGSALSVFSSFQLFYYLIIPLFLFYSIGL